MQNFIQDALTIEVGVATNAAAPPAIQLTWRGTSRAREPAKALLPYLTDAIGEAAQQKLGIEMRFDKLDFFNSATVMAIIKAMHHARASGVRLRLMYAPEVEWQKLSFDPMRVFEKGDDLFQIVPLSRANANATNAVPS